MKRSFLDYVARLPDGRVSTTDGVTHTPDGEFLWAAADRHEDVPEAADRSLGFVGDLRYGGHGGLLFVRLADPCVTLRGGVGTVSVADTFDETHQMLVPLVTFDVTRWDQQPGVEIMRADTVRLTARGATMFNMVYPAGELFEPITMTWPVDRPGGA